MNLLRWTLLTSLLVSPAPQLATAQATGGHGEVAFALHYDPKTLDPAKVDDQASELVRYLTAGVLVRLNRSTLALEPMLAETYSISADGKLVTLRLRPNLRFSDGSPLTSTDVVATFHRVLAPATAAPVADEFVEPAKVTVEAADPLTVKLHLPVRLVAIAAVLDEIAIEPANRVTNGSVTAGPFTIAEYHRGESLRLARNPNYFKHDANGAPLPYLASLRLDILNNRETEELRFARGQYAVLDAVPAESFEALHRRMPSAVHDLGPSLNTEQMWFNQSARAPLPAYEKQWFASRTFRAAVSAALHRADLARVAYDGHATPANGYISPANTTWYNHALTPAREDRNTALQLLASDGFRKQGNDLVDREGHSVKFSILTNAGNRSRERMATLIQQDLAAIGMQVNVVTLDFPALIDRLMHSGDYEAALLGLSDVQPDPISEMNIWLSSSPNHQWNPSEKTPATPWEAEIDRAMHAQAETTDPHTRKAALDHVQSIVADQFPFIYLVYPNTLCAVSPDLDGVRFSVLQPDVLSSVDTLSWKGARR
ncbi:MAG TPA: ABC transporter substrate-binding protein [Acidobacteriaceae bacterium]|nr:ABC transporter substrate-binding protein [Acidobacteriaceae bacterium]